MPLKGDRTAQLEGYVGERRTPPSDINTIISLTRQEQVQSSVERNLHTREVESHDWKRGARIGEAQNPGPWVWVPTEPPTYAEAVGGRTVGGQCLQCGPETGSLHALQAQLQQMMQRVAELEAALAAQRDAGRPRVPPPTYAEAVQKRQAATGGTDNQRGTGSPQGGSGPKGHELRTNSDALWAVGW